MIEPTPFTPASATIGGILIGLSAVWLMASLGRIAGISGIVGSVIRGRDGAGNRGWSLAFLAGLLAGAALVAWLWPGMFVPRTNAPQGLLIIAGLLVGFGTALGSGCTSGHGVCGLSRLSRRSLIATVVFMVSGVITAVTLRHVGGL